MKTNLRSLGFFSLSASLLLVCTAACSESLDAGSDSGNNEGGGGNQIPGATGGSSTGGAASGGSVGTGGAGEGDGTGGSSLGGAGSGGTSSGGTSSGGAGSGGAAQEPECESGERCGADCVDTSSDVAHCGACNAACNSGSRCVSGRCEAPEPSCPVQLVGWAAVNALSVNTTTGGGSAARVRPTTVEQLVQYAGDGQARVIEIQGTFNVSELVIRSNKTLLGVGENATINGGLRVHGRGLSNQTSNVIVRNLRINARSAGGSNDGIEISYAHHVWIDHCEIWDAPDGNLDVVRASDYVTISWTKFRYTSNPPANNHRFSNLIGNGDDRQSEDGGRLKVTLHHNWWAERVHERMPRVRFGQVHVFNNYFSASGNNYAVRAGRGARLLVENNYFQGVRSPHEFNSSTDQGTAHITARNNTYDNTSGTRATGGGGSAFTQPPYQFSLESAADARASVQACVGPRGDLNL